MLCTLSITLVSLCVLSESGSNQTNPGRPTLCRSCGAIVGAGESKCAICGAPTAAAPLPQNNPPIDRETLKFARAVLNRPYKFTILLLVANLFVFLLMWQATGLDQSVLWHEFPESVLLAFGAKQNFLISARHEWWRFVSPMFVHVNLLHLLVNMYSLWIIGPYVEKLYGSAKFVVFWVVTGIAGVLGSYLTVRPSLATTFVGRFLFKPEDVVSAGASGALFGLVGVLFVFGIKYRHELPEGFKRAFGTGMLPVILINLAIGFLGSGFIDNAAHLGGLVAGAALGTLVHYRRPGQGATVAVAWRVLQVAALLLVALSFYKVGGQVSRLAAQQAVARTVVKNQNLLNYREAMTQAQEALSAVIYDQDMSMLQVSLQKLQATPAPDPKADELRHRLLELLMKAGSQVPSPSPGNTGAAAALKARQDLLNQLTVWTNDYNNWVKSSKVAYPGQ